jgi:hypothetical protein
MPPLRKGLQESFLEKEFRSRPASSQPGGAHQRKSLQRLDVRGPDPVRSERLALLPSHPPVLTHPPIPARCHNAIASERTARVSPFLRFRFFAPHIFSHVEPRHAIATDEIFGPVVAIMHAATFQHALDLANASPYKLTGGVFSRKPANLELAKKQFPVGNLYLNRGITGALVARQPFGGFGMSGVGSKAGGADYLLQFVEPRASCENTLRRGFAPEL